MKTNYFKQAWASIRQQPMVSTVSVAGTALAIFLIMIIVMMEEVKTAPFAPESNRDRWLVQKFQSITNDNWGAGVTSNGGIGFNAVKSVFYEMKTPEAVTAFQIFCETASVGVHGKAAFGAETLGVDHGFWKVMDFTFIAGKPFTKTDFDSAIPKAVISESTSRRLFDTVESEGKQFSLNHVPFLVCGVVKDVTSLAQLAYAQIWIPFTTQNVDDRTWCGYMGPLSTVILAKNKKDFPAIREEYRRLYAKLGDEAKADGWKFVFHERPFTQLEQAHTRWADETPDMAKWKRSQLIIYLILLIVPAVNLCSMTQSRLQQRREEIGIRRAFGARRSSILFDIFAENLAITLFAGLIGLAASVAFALIWGSSFFTSAYGQLSTVGINITNLLHWSTFGWAILFCFLLNTLSAGLPSFQASKENIVNALSGKR